MKKSEHEKINYIELPARDLKKTKLFFEEVFGWSFEDFGENYTAFSGGGLDGGFFKSDVFSSTDKGGVLVVFYSQDLEETMSKIKKAGGEIIKSIFSFPGGRRFHFAEPSGNELAVWSDN